MPVTIHFMLNLQPHYHHVTFDAPYEAITVKMILDEAHTAHKSIDIVAGEPECPRGRFKLHHITDESNGFSLSSVMDHAEVLEHASHWYKKKGHFLFSTAFPDESALVKSIVPPLLTADVPVVQLYVIAAADITPTLSTAEAPPLLATRRLYIEDLQRASRQATLLPEDDAAQLPVSGYADVPSYCHPHPDFGPCVFFHETIFAFAKISLEGLLPVHFDLRPLDENLEVLDGKAFDIRICFYDLRRALDEMKYAPDHTCVEALSRMLRELFDDPTLEVNAREVKKGRNPLTELEIRGECYTAHGFPALYIMGKDKLTPGCWGRDNMESFVAYEHAVIGSKYTAAREMTCCPCLIVTMERDSIQFYAAYFSDRTYRVLLCDIPLLNTAYPDGPPGEYSNILKLQVIRKTAQQLRSAYAGVHTGSAIPGAPHLYPLPRLGKYTFPFLPSSPRLVDRVPVTSCPTIPVSISAPFVFTGFITIGDEIPLSVHVKFLVDQKYSVKAHLLLSQHELEGKPMPLAPRFMHYDALPGMRMIVMRTLEGDTLEHLLASGATVSKAELQDVHTAVRLLHRRGFVHGDIRPSNVIIQRPTADNPDGATRAYLTNFEWAGKAGEARYPYDLNEDIRWPRPTKELVDQPITKRDDLLMLKNLLSPQNAKPRDDASATPDGSETQDMEIDEEEPEETEETEESATSDADDGSDDDTDQKVWDFWTQIGIVKGKKADDFGRIWKTLGPYYPEDINPDIVWPRPAEELRCQPVTQAHDRFMLEQMLRDLSRQADASEDEAAGQ